MDAILKDTIECCPAPVCIGLHHIDSSSKPYVVAEIDETVSHIAGQDARERTILLHCVSTYPTAPHDASLSTIAHLQSRYIMWTGYSDHTESIDVAGPAVACGASVLEKHFTLDRGLAGPDHAFSLTPEMFRQYVQTAETAWRMMGRPRRNVADVEQEVRALARKSVVASRAIRRNERITTDMLMLKRPGGGLAPKHLAALVGRTARRDIAADAQVVWDMVD